MELTIENCEDEPIHLCEAVQSRGLLLAVDPATGLVRIYSVNVSIWFEIEIVIGKTLITELIDLQADECEWLYSKLDEGRERKSLDFKLKPDRLLRQWHSVSPGVIYTSGDLLVFELEPFLEVDRDNEQLARFYNYQKLLPNLFALQTVESIAADISDYVREFTGFDRVMVYKFDEQYNGSVIAESKTPNLEDSYLGMQFPAADIPPQARKLYELNWIRSVFDVDAATAGLLPKVNSVRKPLDLSLSMVRAVSPIHIQYLKNMGVQATMSISIMKEGRLWGLIACHHYSSRYLPQNRRLACEALGQLYSWQLVGKEQSLASRVVRRGRDEFIDILQSFRRHDDFEKNIVTNQARILGLMDACGFAVVLPNQIETIGITPPKASINSIIAALYEHCSYSAKSSFKLKEIVAANVQLGGVCGAMALPISAYHDSHVVWFRSAREKTVNWAGREAYLKASGDEGVDRLSPRGSFALWQQVVRDESPRWTPEDVSIAESFNNFIMSYLIEKKLYNERQIQKFEELDRAKDQFLASISHELRSPLNAIVGWTDLALYDVKNTDKMIEALGVIKRSAHTQAELINDLLDLSRIVAGTLQLSVHTLHVQDLLIEAVKSFETALTSKEIQFELVCDDASNTILGDKVRLKQVITNLMSNAIKFTPKGGSIRLLGYREYSNFFIELKDSGKGLDKDELEKVFDRFYQSSRTHGRQGLGLGLAICKQLVELHGGEITAQSDGENQGATFVVCLPIAPSMAEAGAVKLTNGLPAKESSCALAGLRIMVVEDEEDSCMFLKHFLNTQGAEVDTSANGQQCLEILNRSADVYDLVLSDIGMPVMDGIELVRAIRESELDSVRSLVCIALTAYAYATDRVKALKAGFDSYVSKPIDAEELLTIVEMQMKIRNRQAGEQ